MTPRLAVVGYAVGLVACRYPQLLEVDAATGEHVLPAGTIVPSVASDPVLATQIAESDGLDDASLAATGGVIARLTGGLAPSGQVVAYWSFGSVPRATSPMYVFYAGGELIDHPALVGELPGDPGYSALHVLHRVQVTSKYAGERITTTAALAEAIRLGLVADPVSTDHFVASPIVRPGVALDIGGAAPVLQPTTIYVRGNTASMFRFGGARGVQPVAVPTPASQVSFLRQAHEIRFDTTRPIFQTDIPATPAAATANYTALSEVANVDLVDGVQASAVTREADLFVRAPTGELTATTFIVAHLEITTAFLLLPLQFAEAEP